MRVLVLGAEGMLGRELVTQLVRDKTEEVVGANSRDGDVLDLQKLEAIRKIYGPDLVINCAGSPNKGSLVNSLGPWNVAHVFHCKVWNISTDCVFDHTRPYKHRRDDTPKPQTEYGVSKVLGEIVAPHVTNIRTSFIGYKHGLLKWFLNLPKDSVVEGWRKATWSGSTVYAVAEKLSAMTKNMYDLANIEHLATETPISKYEVLCVLKTEFASSVDIQAVDAPYVNRMMIPTIYLTPATIAIRTLPSLVVRVVGEAQAYV